MKSLFRILGIYAAFLLQSLIFENLNIFSQTPDILVTVLIFTAISCSGTEAMAFGIFAGILTDCVCGRFFGVYTLLYMYLAVCTSFAVPESTKNSPIICAWALFVCTTVYEIIFHISLVVFGNFSSISDFGMNLFVKGLFAAVFAFFAVLIINNSEKKRKKKSVLKEGDSLEA